MTSQIEADASPTTFGCLLRSASMSNVQAARTLLGHGRLTTTELYLNLSPEDAIREFMEKW